MADADIDGKDVNQNYGIWDNLRVQIGNYEKYTRRSYLRFDLSGLDDPGIARGVLRLSLRSHSGGTPSLLFKLVEDDSWGEYDITYTKPPVASNLITSAVCLNTNWVFEVDVSDAVRREWDGDQLFSFEISVLSKHRVIFHSKEAGEGLWPELVIYSVPTKWDEFVAMHGLSGVATNDFDGDGRSDIEEFSLNGNPTNAAVSDPGITVTRHPDGTASFYNLQHTHSQAGLVYQGKWCTNLMSGTWSTNFSLVTNVSTANPEYDQVERQLNDGSYSPLFFRLRLLQP